MISSDCIRGWKHCDLKHPLTIGKPFTGNHLSLNKGLIIFNSGVVKNLQIADKVADRVCVWMCMPFCLYVSVYVCKLLHAKKCACVLNWGCRLFVCLTLFFKLKKDNNNSLWLEMKATAKLLKWDKEFQGNLPFTVRHSEQLLYGDQKH